ncbi:MAG: hypothetical protein ACI8S2_001114, partial [Bacteroidia bacterium]
SYNNLPMQCHFFHRVNVREIIGISFHHESPRIPDKHKKKAK